ncbi:MAG: four helix bundle protein [Acidobacteriaceae bacterium]|nr:four helix bundle protein [Acidobacteriaceae bacterium]
MPKSYRDLVVWQRSVDLAELTYRLTRAFPKEELYGLAAQMRRASVSVASNIAEGSARSRGDFHRYVVMARGSNNELQTQLVIAQRLGFGDQQIRDNLESLSEEVGRSLTKFADYLRRSDTA